MIFEIDLNIVTNVTPETSVQKQWNVFGWEQFWAYSNVIVSKRQVGILLMTFYAIEHYQLTEGLLFYLSMRFRMFFMRDQWSRSMR